MKIKKIRQLEDFLSTLNKCKGKVWLEDNDGNNFNLKSELSKYVAIGALLQDKYEELGLFCQLQEDEMMFFEYFNNYPEVQ